MVRLSVNACKNWKKSAWFRRRAPLEEGLHLAEEAPEPEDGALLALVNGLPPNTGRWSTCGTMRSTRYTDRGPAGPVPALVSTHLARARAKLRERLEGSCCDG
ncbi:MAG: hypothetical protein ACLRIS_06635 [Flavonifractor plautii]